MRTVERVVCLVWLGYTFKAGCTYSVDDSGKFIYIKTQYTWQHFNKFPQNSKFRPAYKNDKEEE